MSRPWDVWGNDVLTAEWATAEVRNEWSSMKPGIFMDVEIRNRSGLSDLSQNRPKFWPYGFEWESSKGKIGVVTMDSSG